MTPVMVLWETCTLISPVVPNSESVHTKYVKIRQSHQKLLMFTYFEQIGGGFDPPCFICHVNVFSSDQNCSKDPNRQTSTPDSKSMLTKYIQIGPDLTVYSFRTEPIWGFKPPHFMFHLNVFPWNSNCATETSLQ